MNAPKVLEAINRIQAALSKEGISKDRQNTQQNYRFRGIDDVYNALSHLLAEHKLVIVPRMLERQVWERESAGGKALFYIVVTAEFDFISAEDGSQVTVRTFGEGMDSADKGTSKALSTAYKYAAFMTFAIPTEGSGHDVEEEGHDVRAGAGQSRAGGSRAGGASPSKAPDGFHQPRPPAKPSTPTEGTAPPKAGVPPDSEPPPEGGPAKPPTPVAAAATQREPRKRPVPSGDSEIDAIKFADLSKLIVEAKDEATLKFAFLDAYQFAADVDDDRVGKSWQLSATQLKDERKKALGIK